MFIHLGSDHMVALADVIAIINVDEPIAESIRDIIQLAIADKKICRICDKGQEKSLIITDDKIYLSPISSVTLFKRCRSLYEEV